MSYITVNKDKVSMETQCWNREKERKRESFNFMLYKKGSTSNSFT